MFAHSCLWAHPGTNICPGTTDDPEAEAQLKALLADPDAIPLPTYFIGAWGAAADAVLRELITDPHPKLHYLGRCVAAHLLVAHTHAHTLVHHRAGVLQVHGLTVAYLDGMHSASQYTAPPPADSLTCQHYTQVGVTHIDAFTLSDQHAHAQRQEDVALLQSALEGATADVDFLLTNDWPEGVVAGQPDSLRPEGLSLHGSSVVAEIAERARPRYHVAAGKVCGELGYMLWVKWVLHSWTDGTRRQRYTMH